MGENHPVYRSPVGLSHFAMIAIGLVALGHFFGAVIGVAEIAMPDRTFDVEGLEGQSFWLMVQSLIAVLGLLAFVIAVVAFLMWLYRTYVNLPALRADNVEFTPGWAVGWWFIPFANLVKPFQVVRNVWSESDPDLDVTTGFLTSVQAGAPGFMAAWWAFWLISNIAENITGRVFDPDDIRTVEISGYAFIISGILRIIAALLAAKVIYSITTRQEQRFAVVGHIPEQGPPPPPSFE